MKVVWSQGSLRACVIDSSFTPVSNTAKGSSRAVLLYLRLFFFDCHIERAGARKVSINPCFVPEWLSGLGSHSLVSLLSLMRHEERYDKELLGSSRDSLQFYSVKRSWQ